MDDRARAIAARRRGQVMSGFPPLAQPLTADVASDGRLIHADDALRRLHLRAGGEEGGMLAIPGLVALGMLVHRLKMRLARAVRIADGSDNAELWVEAALAGDVARLSVLSWRDLPDEIEVAATAKATASDARRAIYFFDSELKLVSVQGEIPDHVDATAFGKGIDILLADIWAQNPELLAPIQKWQNVDGQTGNGASIVGEPVQAMDGTFSGYRCEVDVPISVAAPVPVATTERIAPFGEQLAPMLRQPLGRIIANAETIGHALNGPVRENYSTYARDIADAARHLSALVEDLGDLEAVERPGFTTAPDRIELGDVARRVAGLLALKAADHHIRIITPAPAKEVPAVAEFRRVLQILLNLVTNAVRYSPDGTEVTIDITSRKGQAFISVSDQGAGIAVEDRERIFEKFERLGRSGDGGSGLGLYISRRLARAMGGELSVDAAPNGGAQFTLSLPTKAA